MKFTHLITSVFFLALLSVSFVSAGVGLGYEFEYRVIGLTPNEDLSLEKMMVLCALESCEIDKEQMTVTIKSHYDNRVALVISRTGEDKMVVATILPYELNPDAFNNCTTNCYPYIENPDINPDNYDYAESIGTDLNFLGEKGVILISDSEINEIKSIESKQIRICDGSWKDTSSSCSCDVDAVCALASTGNLIPFPTLPLNEFNLNRDSSNLVYWIIGGGVVVIVVLFLIFRKKR